MNIISVEQQAISAIRASDNLIMTEKRVKMAPTIRPDMVKSFSGEGDVEAWLSKVELVAKLTNIDDVASFIPLYLEGGALAVYLEMGEHQKTDIRAIKGALRDAFADNQFIAYARMRECRWAGETVDVFANELRRLAKLSGFTGDGLEHVVKLAFITGFPDNIGLDLQQVVGVGDMKVADIIGRARVLAQNTGGVAAPAVEPVPKGKKFGVKCYQCGGPHFVRDCSERRRKFVCFVCGEEGHIASRCKANESRGRGRGATGERDTEHGKSMKGGTSEQSAESGVGCASGRPTYTSMGGVRGVPVIRIRSKGRSLCALVDTGCSNTMIKSQHVDDWTGEVHTKAVDGRTVKCKGTAQVELEIAGEYVEAKAIVVDDMVGTIDVVIGMDIIEKLGGLTVGNKTVQFGRVACAVVDETSTRTMQRPGKITIHDKDFEATFEDVWTVKYHWKNGQAPQLKNRIAMYENKMNDATRESFDGEIEKWIEQGILRPWAGEVDGIIPLMAVEQPTKNKVRPVLDFREVNEFVECHTGDDLIDVCGDRMREWRKVEGEPEIVDLSAAYLQLRVDPDLWKYQVVQYKGKNYCLTRLGFGLNSAPRIMTKVLKTVLEQSQEIGGATSSYIDDILVDVSQVKTGEVISHLAKYGLLAKPAMQLEGEAALGLKLSRGSDGMLVFGRNSDVPVVSGKLSKRELFSICGKLVGHYPVAGWLRIATSFIKRQSEGEKWTDYIGDRAQLMIEEVVDAVLKDDPVRGKWGVKPTEEGVVWCDASNLGMGVLVEMDGVVVEDGAWLRKTDDHHHINVAELEAVLKGVNLGIKWGLRTITVVTDSATVSGWIRVTLSEEKRVKTGGAAEILVKRRLGTLKALVEELGITIEVRLVPSKDNKADVLTRVKKEWLCQTSKVDFRRKGAAISAATNSVVKDLHDQHHMGVERSWYLAKEVDPTITKQQVKEVVKNCARCQSIDPAPLQHEVGGLEVNAVWERLAVDITHFHGIAYLTMVDCGPGRFTIWRQLKSEAAQHIVEELGQVFRERGPVRELLLDNATAFRSDLFTRFLESWKVRPYYRAAYRPSGNGIVERNHRTIKAMAERGNMSPMEAVFYFNSAPRYRQEEETIPQRSVFRYEWRQPAGPESDDVRMNEPSAQVTVGDEVWVKPPNARCTTQWNRGVVTKVNSASNIEVDHMPRHILDLRTVAIAEDDVERDQQGVAAGETEDRRYPQRDRRVPAWQGDYVLY